MTECGGDICFLFGQEQSLICVMNYFLVNIIDPVNVQIISGKDSVGVMEMNNGRKIEGMYYQNTMCPMS